MSRTPVTPDVAQSLDTVLLAVRSAGARTYHPSHRTLSVILEPGPDPSAVQVLPSFLIVESVPTRRGLPDDVRCERVDDFEEAVDLFRAPLGSSGGGVHLSEVDAAAFEAELCRRLDARFADPDLAALATRDTFGLHQFIDFFLPDDKQVVIETRHDGYRVAGLAFRVERR